AVPTSEPNGRQPSGFAANVASGHAFCKVVKREGSCLGSCTTTEWRFASWAAWVRLTSRLAPPALEVFAAVETWKEGLNASAPQPPTWNGLDRLCVAPNVEVSVVSVASGPQLVGLNRKLGRLIATLRSFSLS